jgi:hypothetical protein
MMTPESRAHGCMAVRRQRSMPASRLDLRTERPFSHQKNVLHLQQLLQAGPLARAAASAQHRSSSDVARLFFALSLCCPVLPVQRTDIDVDCGSATSAYLDKLDHSEPPTDLGPLKQRFHSEETWLSS